MLLGIVFPKDDLAEVIKIIDRFCNDVKHNRYGAEYKFENNISADDDDFYVLILYIDGFKLTYIDYVVYGRQDQNLYLLTSNRIKDLFYFMRDEMYRCNKFSEKTIKDNLIKYCLNLKQIYKFGYHHYETSISPYLNTEKGVRETSTDFRLYMRDFGNFHLYTILPKGNLSDFINGFIFMWETSAEAALNRIISDMKEV